MPEFMKLMEDWGGFDSVRRGQSDGQYEARLVEAINLINNTHGMPSHRREYLIREALTTSDFPLLFGDILDRQLLAAYKGTPNVMESVVRTASVRDFRTVNRYRMNDGDQVLTAVPEKEEYPKSDRDEVRYQYSVSKYGRVFDISWESIINDDLNALKDTPNRFALASRRSEEKFITELFWDANGPLDAYFAGNGGAAAVSSLPLTIPNLETAIEEMLVFTDTNSEPILNEPKYLVTGPALKLQAQQILKSAMKMWTESAGGGATPYPMANILAELNIIPLVNHYIPIVCTTGTIAQTTWALFSDPNDLAAGEFGRLSGHESPEIFMKSANQRRVGGGEVNPMDGDFATDNILYKVRHVFGGVVMDGRAGWASDGQ